MLLAPAAAMAAEMPFSVLTRTTRSAVEFKLVPDEGRHVAQEFPCKMMVRTSPETELERTVELQGRTGDLETGLVIELPVTRPLLVDVELHVGICDASGTCTRHHVGWQVEVARRPSRGFKPVELLAVQMIARKQKILQQARETDVLPFRTWHRDDLPGVLAEAQDRAEPALLVFKTRWCPPCNELWTEVLHNPRHAVDLAPFVKGVFDADLRGSWEAKTRFQVGGYPTLVVCTPEGEVVWRQEGYEGAEALIAELDRVLLEAVPLEELEAGAQADPAAMLALADRYRHARDREAAARWMAQIPGDADIDPLVALHVRAYLATSDEDAARGAAALEELLLGQTLNPVAPPLQQASWWHETARLWRRVAGQAREQGQDEAVAAEASEKVTLALERLRATAEHVLASQPDPATAAEAHSMAAWASRELGGDVAAKASWSAAADLHLQMLGSPVDDRAVTRKRGHLLQAAHALTAAGRTEEAVAVLDAALQVDPDEATFLYLRARASQGRQEAALEDAAEALRLAEGDLRLRVAGIYSDLLEGVGRVDEAVALLDDVLAEQSVPVDQRIRTHRYVDGLRARLARMTTEEPP